MEKRREKQQTKEELKIRNKMAQRDHRQKLTNIRKFLEKESKNLKKKNKNFRK